MNANKIVRALKNDAKWVKIISWANALTPGSAEFLAISERITGAADLIESMQAQLAASQRRADAAVKELTRQLKVPDDDICAHCRNQIECRQTECEQYESGVGATSVDGTEYPNFKWSCMDFDHGTCNKMQNTSCSGCFDNEYSGFEWRGPQAEEYVEQEGV